MMESKVHAKNIVNWAKDKDDVLVLSGDLTASCEITEFSEAYPEKFVSMGMAEQNMLSWAGGLAREGYKPFLHTFSVFLTRRPYDQLAMSICYPNLPVKLIGFLPGMMTPGGVTHQAIDDLNLMRGLPNMTILETGDAADIESVLDVAYEIDGPVYIRMLRGSIPRLFHDPMKLNHARTVEKGSDGLVLSSGFMTAETMRAVGALKDQGINVTHLHVSTLKPFNDPGIDKELQETNGPVFTIDNHYINGGLGTCVAERMAELGVTSPLHRFALTSYQHGATMEYLLHENRLDAQGIASRVLEKFGKSVKDEDLKIPELESTVLDNSDESRLEAL